MNAAITIISMKCDKCNTTYSITEDKRRRRNKAGIPNYCTKCMKEYANEKRKKYFDSLSNEEKQKYKDKRNWYAKATEEQKKEHAQKSKNQWINRSNEDQLLINKKNSDSLKKHWEKLSENDKYKRTLAMREANKKYWESLSSEEKTKLAKRWLDKLTEEERIKKLRELSEKMSRYNESLDIEEKRLRAKNMERWHNNLNEEQKKELYERTHQWYHNLSEEEKLNYAQSRRDKWNELDENTKILIIKKKFKSVNKNNLNKKFESYFTSSYLSNQYYFKPEEVLSNETIHSWDYGIYSKDTNELVMVVDLDGSYFHADSCDYDGLHSKEEYDERRSLSIPDNIKYLIIQEKIFKKCFEFMMKIIISNYDEFINSIFKYCRSMPFPYPKYDDNELIKSWLQLKNMKCNDKYHQDISLNTRIGDRLIQHFHESIYHANRKGNISPYEAWYNDELLMKCIENRVIYQSYLNPNKILQGFNISKIAMKVSVFSAGRAKMLINKYLLDCNEIFDPFSGFSGRMLGAVSLGKRYIGQDISSIHVRESNEIIKFLHIDDKATINQQDILQSNGEYECLFTCPPYEDIEQWQDVKPDKRTCDDWIDECLSRFKCRKYLFVVDYTEKYIDYVVDEIINKSHFGSNSEYIVQIIR